MPDEAGWSALKTKTVGVTLGLGKHNMPAPGDCVPVLGSLISTPHVKNWNKQMLSLMVKRKL